MKRKQKRMTRLCIALPQARHIQCRQTLYPDQSILHTRRWMDKAICTASVSIFKSKSQFQVQIYLIPHHVNASFPFPTACLPIYMPSRNASPHPLARSLQIINSKRQKGFQTNIMMCRNPVLSNTNPGPGPDPGPGRALHYPLLRRECC
jgi:hypothetical protein